MYKRGKYYFSELPVYFTINHNFSKSVDLASRYHPVQGRAGPPCRHKPNTFFWPEELQSCLQGTMAEKPFTHFFFLYPPEEDYKQIASLRLWCEAKSLPSMEISIKRRQETLGPFLMLIVLNAENCGVHRTCSVDPFDRKQNSDTRLWK